MSVKTGFLSIPIMAIFLSVAKISAATVAFESGEQKTSLLELYTSEGCSSCPPAEARFSELRSNPGLWKSFVPVAFHVDYWNNLGWADRFSSSQFTERQHKYGDAWKTTTVYTPEFVLDGREWRNEMAPPTPGLVGRLKIVLEDGRQVHASFQPAAGVKGPFTLYVSPLGQNVVTEVRNGENAGRKLTHDFVALALLSVPLDDAGSGEYSASVILPASLPAPDTALAAWVCTTGNPAPLQAVGGSML